MRSSTSCVSTLCAVIAAAIAAPTVTIGEGVVIGTTTSLPTATATVNKFLGIPFAQSPPQRFSPPVSLARSNRIINATAWRPACIQQFVYPLATHNFAQQVFNNPGGAPPQESEDCLYLNVYAPSTPAGGNGRAVLFWIYGGGLQFGNAGQYGYDGSAFAAYEDVIVVSVNYRTNVFGFPSSPELPATGHNLGFLDQRAALEWVQCNIPAFGGDPERVTIFGESAGGFSVDALLTSFPKGSNPPFQGAILESGQYSYRSQFPASTVPAWDNLTATLGCPGNYGSNLACVRAANATRIKDIIEQNILEFDPIPDNVTLVSDPAGRRTSGNIAYVPVMGGTNSQEGRVFAVGQTNVTNFLRNTFSANLAGYPNTSATIDAIQALYPVGSNGLETGYDVISQIYTELQFQCPQALWANASAAAGIPTWRYYFNATFANTQGFTNLGAYHSSEISLVFGTHPVPLTTTQERALTTSMQSTWARFAKNPAGGPGWNQVGTGAADNVLTHDGQGSVANITGGLYLSANQSAVTGDYDLGVWGTVGDVLGGGITVIPQSAVDYRCSVYMPIYQAVLDAKRNSG